MSFFEYPEYWSKEQIDFAEKLLDVIRESPLSCSDVCGVMNDVSERIDNISRRAGELFSAKETLPRAAEKIKQTYR